MFEEKVEYKIKVDNDFQRDELTNLLRAIGGVVITSTTNYHTVSAVYIRWTGDRHITTYDKGVCFYDQHFDRKPLTLVDLVLMEGLG